ncbi:MAG: GGDEF domain-containing protein [Myxococcales bacterium]|nr:GGDEF domain-containing protein [Myxococcales bacterium]
MPGDHRLREILAWFESVATGPVQLAPCRAEDPMEQVLERLNGLARRLGTMASSVATLEKVNADLARAHAELERRQTELLDLAVTDPLTGLANRARFEDDLEDALAVSTIAGDRVAVLMIDLDGFKPINDTFGHAAGDAVLRAVATRLSRIVGNAGLASRLGGDEFAVVVSGVSFEDAERLAARVRDTIAVAIAWEGMALHVNASIGVAVSNSPDVTAFALTAAADNAMYAAKRRGVGLIQAVFCPEEEAGEKRSQRPRTARTERREAATRRVPALRTRPTPTPDAAP